MELYAMSSNKLFAWIKKLENAIKSNDGNEKLYRKWLDLAQNEWLKRIDKSVVGYHA